MTAHQLQPCFVTCTALPPLLPLCQMCHCCRCCYRCQCTALLPVHCICCHMHRIAATAAVAGFWCVSIHWNYAAVQLHWPLLNLASLRCDTLW